MRHLRTCVYIYSLFYYWYIYNYLLTSCSLVVINSVSLCMLLSYKLKCAIFRFALAVFISSRSQLTTQPPTWLHDYKPLQAITSRAPYLFIYIVFAYHLLTTYLPLTYHLLTTYSNRKRSTDRYTPFHANCLRFRALSVWGVSLFPTRPSSAALSRYFFIFIFSYSAIFISPLL